MYACSDGGLIDMVLGMMYFYRYVMTAALLHACMAVVPTDLQHLSRSLCSQQLSYVQPTPQLVVVRPFATVLMG